MKALTRDELAAVFSRAWAETRDPVEVAEAIQRAVLANVENAQYAEDRIVRTGKSAPIGRRAARQAEWSPDRDPRIEAIIQAVSAHRLIPVCEIKGSGFPRLVVRARHEAAWLVRVTLGYSYAIIGASLGGCDHSSVLMGCRKIQGLVDADPAYGERLLALVAPVVGEAQRAA